MKNAGLWKKIGIGATILWMIGFSLYAYLHLAASVAEERRLGKLWCPSGDANCLATNVSHWVSSSEALLATYAILEAISIAAIFWTVVGLGVAAIQWGLDGRQPASRTRKA